MRSVISGILSGCSDLAGRRCGFRVPCGLFHTPAAVESCRKTAKKCENGLRISQTAYHAACFSTRFSTGCGKVLPSCVGNGKENVGLRRRCLPRLACSPRRCCLRRGGLPFLPPVYPDFSFTSAPYPPVPLPRRGRGRLKVYFAGAPPPAPPGLNLRFAAKPTEFLYLEQCRQPRRGGTGGEELRRLRWSSPPGQVEQMPHGERSPAPRRVAPEQGRIARWRRGLPPRFSFHALTGAAGCDILVYRTEPPRRTARKQKGTSYRTAIPERRKGENRA